MGLAPEKSPQDSNTTNMISKVIKPDILSNSPNADLEAESAGEDSSKAERPTIKVEAREDSSKAERPTIKAEAREDSSKAENVPKTGKTVGKTKTRVPEEDITLMLARTRFSLAELYTFSFDRPDSALTQYKCIIQEAPGSEFAIKSEYFLDLNELHTKGSYSEETEKALMMALVTKYPKSEFVQDLKVYLGIIEKTPDVRAYIRAEYAMMSGEDQKVYMPLYQAVVDSFPDTKTAYKARFMIAYAYEHYLGDKEKAFELYKKLAEEKPTVNSEVYVNLAIEKLKYANEEKKLLKEIEKNIAYYDMILEGNYEGLERSGGAGEQLAAGETGLGKGYTGYKKIRVRNARIRGRYYPQ
jgi:tetratricopeptide (TPR) repeat protein